MLWTNADSDAGWRATIRSHATYLHELAAKGLPLPGPFKISSLYLEGIMCDVLHAVDQGVACHVVANVFIEIMGLRHWGGNQELQLKGLQVNVRTILLSAFHYPTESE